MNLNDTNVYPLNFLIFRIGLLGTHMLVVSMIALFPARAAWHVSGVRDDLSVKE
jgi:hypothetical protein